MKKILGLLAAVTVLALGTNAFAAAFTAGNIVIYRVGDGTQTLTNAGNTVFLDEFTTNGTWVQSIMMPTNWYGANAPLITDGGGFAQGAITRSVDGRFIVLTGFAGTPGTFTNFSILSSFASNQVPRVVGLVDGLGNINTKTTQTNVFAEEEIRSAASTDGTNLWFSGAGTGIKATTRGSLVATQVEKTVTNVRDLNIYTNQLFFTASTGIRDTTNFFLPTTTNALVAILPGTATNNTAPFGFAFFNLGGGASNDTLYVTEGSVTFSGEGNGAVLKYSLIGGTNWVNSGSIGAGNATGLAGFSDNAGVHLFITTGGTATPNALGTLYPFVDTTGFKGNVATNAGGNDANLTGVTLSPNGLGNSTFNARGIAMAPAGGEGTLNSAFNGVASVGPPYGIATVGNFGSAASFFPSNFVYSEANFGTANLNFSYTVPTWLTASPASGTIVPGGSITVNFSVNANAGSLPAGTTSGFVTFRPGATVFRPWSIQVNAFTLNPSTNFTVIGPVGGPFVPSSQTYVLSNATSGALNWTVNTAQPWSGLSATAGSLAGFASTNITYSITNSAANSLTAGQYADSITFSNASGSALLNAIGVTLQVGFGIFDDYSTYLQNADLVGQNGWVALDNPGVSPLQVASGVLSIPRSCVNGEEPDKNWSITAVTTNSTGGGVLYAGMQVTVTSAEISASPPYAFSALVGIGINNPSFLRDAGSPVASGGGYVWGTRQATDTGWVFGTTTRSFGTSYLVIVAGDLLGTNSWIFVNPLASSTNVNLSATDHLNLFTMTPDCFNSGGDGEDTLDGVGGWVWGQFGAATCQAGLTVSKFAMSTNYTDVYKFLAGAAPPPPTDPFTTWQSNYFTVAELGTPSFSGPNADPFGKGMSNTNQFLAGFNPTNAAAYVHITSITKTNGGTDIRVDYLGASGDNTYSPGFASRTNVLEFTAGAGGNYNSNNFASTGQTNILSGGNGSGTLANMVDPGGATNVPSRYYRVRVLVP